VFLSETTSIHRPERRGHIFQQGEPGRPGQAGSSHRAGNSLFLEGCSCDKGDQVEGSGFLDRGYVCQIDLLEDAVHAGKQICQLERTYTAEQLVRMWNCSLAGRDLLACDLVTPAVTSKLPETAFVPSDDQISALMAWLCPLETISILSVKGFQTCTV
jgi:hypothetical protein